MLTLTSEVQGQSCLSLKDHFASQAYQGLSVLLAAFLLSLELARPLEIRMEQNVGLNASQEKETSSQAPDGSHHQVGVDDVSDSDPPKKASLSRIWWSILCFSMLVAEMQASLETTMTADLQATVIHTFGEVSKFPWINVTYSLALGASCLLW